MYTVHTMSSMRLSTFPLHRLILLSGQVVLFFFLLLLIPHILLCRFKTTILLRVWFFLHIYTFTFAITRSHCEFILNYMSGSHKESIKVLTNHKTIFSYLNKEDFSADYIKGLPVSPIYNHIFQLFISSSWIITTDLWYLGPWWVVNPSHSAKGLGILVCSTEM